MISSLLAALGAAACFGVATVLQKMGVRDAGTPKRFSLGLLVTFARQRTFALGVALDTAGFALNLVALQRLPLFLVQSVIASAAAVTAMLASRYLGEHLGRSERWAVLGIIVGLSIVAASASPDTADSLHGAGRTLLLAGPPLLMLAAAAADRTLVGRREAFALSTLAGLAFAGFGIAGRILPTPHTATSLTANPLAWAVPAFAVLGVTLFGAALQRGSATSVTTVAMIVETLVPTAVGFFLSDHARPGLALAAITGFTLSFAGAVVLAWSKPPRPNDPSELLLHGP